jgi:hypothetical protein
MSSGPFAPGPSRQLPARGAEQASFGENPRRRRPSPTGEPARAGAEPDDRPSGGILRPPGGALTDRPSRIRSIRLSDESAFFRLI